MFPPGRLEVVVLTLQPNCQTRCSLLLIQCIIYTFNFDVGMTSEERGTSVPSVVPLRPCKVERMVCFTFYFSLFQHSFFFSNCLRSLHSFLVMSRLLKDTFELQLIKTVTELCDY